MKWGCAHRVPLSDRALTVRDEGNAVCESDRRFATLVWGTSGVRTAPSPGVTAMLTPFLHVFTGLPSGPLRSFTSLPGHVSQAESR